MKKLLTLLAGCMLVVFAQAQLVQVVNEVFYTDDGSVTDYPAGATTYRIYAEMTDGADALTAVYAETGSSLLLGTENDMMWNTAFGAITGDALNAAFFGFFPQSEYDSFVTIGRASNGDPGNAITAVSVSPTASVIADSFDAAAPSQFNPDLNMTDGTWFSTPDGANTNGVGPNFRILLAQITTVDDIEYNLNLQVLDNGIGGTQFKYVWDPASIDSPEEADGSGLGLSYAPTSDVLGCVDNTACNYDVAATLDDGSCVFATGCDTCSGETDGSGTVVDNPEVGEACDDGDAGTFMDTVQADCSCAGVTIVDGCTDNTACNYNMAANNDDGSCVFATGCDTCSGETDGSGTVVDNPEVGEACDDGDAGTFMDTVQADCSCAGVTIVDGCTDNTACNYNMAANNDDGSCVFATGCDTCSGETDGSGTVVDNPEVGEACDDGDAGTFMDTVQADCSCAGVTIVDGCTDNTACNYNMAANNDDGSCVFATGCDTCSGETDGSGTVVDNPEVGEACDDGDAGTFMDTVQADCSCAGVTIVDGCTDNTACNYNMAANNDDGSCVFATGCDTCSGETDGSGTVVDNPEVGEACDDGDAGTFMDTVQADCSCAGVTIVDGCTDNTACNYNMAANNDDGSCVFATGCDTCSGETDGSGTVVDNPEVGEACDDGDAGTFMDTVQADCSCAGVTIVDGCTDNTACNYNMAANNDDGSCVFATGCDTCSGETDGSGTVVDNPEVGEACDDGDAGTFMDTVQADCSCAGVTIVDGCTDNTACNYNMAANNDDGSCVFATGCDTCSGETDGSGTVVDNPEVGEACDDGDAGTFMDTVQADCSCAGVTIVDGCTDNTACNYNMAANNDDGSCVFATGCDTCSGETDGSGTVVDNPEVGEACDDGDAGTIMDTVQADCSCAGVAVLDGCTDMAACNYNAAANNDDGTCIFAMGCDSCSGETDGTGTVVDNPETGEACDDGDPATLGDTIQADCSCAGVNPTLPESQLDYPAGDYDLCELVKADWVGADDYRFVFAPQPSGTVIQVEQGGPNTFLLLNEVVGLEVGTTYGVTVDALFGTTWSIGTISKDVTIVSPLPAVNPNDACGAHGPHFLGDYISATPYVCGGDKWEWTFTASGQLPVVYTRNSSNRFLRLSSVPGLTPGTEYQVSVRAGYPNGAFTPASADECIAIVGAAPGGAAGGPEVDTEVAVSRNRVEAQVAVYPNPTQGDLINLNLTGVMDEKVTLDIVNMMGASVLAVELTVNAGTVNEVVHLNGLASGMYLVNTTLNGQVFTTAWWYNASLAIQKHPKKGAVTAPFFDAITGVCW